MAKAVVEHPCEMTIHLFAPGMSLLHRAGLGGLACTLHALQKSHTQKRLSAKSLPAPVEDGKYPWVIEPHSVTLKFGRAENASGYLERLFAFAFDIRKDGLIHLPGQTDCDIHPAALADLQSGLILTFLQHGKVRKLDKTPTVVTYDSDSEGQPGVRVEYKKCESFKHQDGWRELVDKKGRLKREPVRIDGPLSPGTVIRHVAFTGDTGAEAMPELVLPVYFALVGCLALPVNRGVAALIVPEVTDLTEFVYARPAMTPTTASDCQIANAADAAFRAQSRLRRSPRRDAEVHIKSRQRIESHDSIPSCYAMTFMPTAWASQQKSRVATLHVAGQSDALDRFEVAMSHLPTRIKSRTVKETSGKGKAKVTKEHKESFRADSVTRPLIAENLALNRKWFAGFVKLMTKINPATDKPYRDQLSYPEERKGLHAMISDDRMWDEAGERIVVQAVHEALRTRYGQIADENKTNPVAMKNRFGGEYDRWRLAFAGSKTPDQFRKALCDLFSRAGRNGVLQKQWADVLPMLRTANWQHARDLALLALCSYQGGKSESPETPN